MTDVIQVSVRRELRSDRLRDQLPRPSRRVVSVLLTTAVAVDVCGVMRREGKGTGQMIEPHPQCSAYCRHSPPPLTPRWCVKQNTATDRVASFCHRNNTIWRLRQKNSLPLIPKRCLPEQQLLLLHLFNGLFSRTTWVSLHPKGKPFWVLLEQEMTGLQWHQPDHMQIICTSLQTDNHASTPPQLEEENKRTRLSQVHVIVVCHSND